MYYNMKNSSEKINSSLVLTSRNSSGSLNDVTKECNSNLSGVSFMNIFGLKNNWHLVGLLHVNIFGAKGLIGKPNAYCILELDNEHVQTPIQRLCSEPTWNKSYKFNVYDVTSSLVIKVYNSALLNEPLGKASLPLLMIANGKQQWYALKNRNIKYLAKGNCPRVCLEMTLIWNPMKASLKLFRPKIVKHVRKPRKYDVALVYSNVEFIGNTFNYLYQINEGFKRLFEWDDMEFSFVALIGWLVFCFYLQLWTVPLLILLPFIYQWFFRRCQNDKYHILHTSNPSDWVTTKQNNKVDKGITGKLQDLQDTTLAVTNGIEYIAAVAEKLNNLITFQVPFLSYLTMLLLVVASTVLYFIPFNYILMIIGVYKFARKYLNPDRVFNNDLLDFISRIPNDDVLKDWKQLNVPEPVQNQRTGKLARSVSTGVLPY